MLAPKSIGIFSQLRSLFKKKLGLIPLIKVKILREKHTHTHIQMTKPMVDGYPPKRVIILYKYYQ
jgi:hypothetical protein